MSVIIYSCGCQFYDDPKDENLFKRCSIHIDIREVAELNKKHEIQIKKTLEGIIIRRYSCGCEEYKNGINYSTRCIERGMDKLNLKHEYSSPEKETPINHPKHYNFGTIEVIDVIEDWKLGFHLGNAIKYIARAEHKEDFVADLKKAKWYIDRFLEKKVGAK